VDVYFAQFNKEHAGLAFNFQVNPDSCGNHEHYENYLRFIALTDRKIGKGVTHVLIHKDSLSDMETIIGFVTLRASSLISESDNVMLGSAAIEVAEIAIDKRYERQGYGNAILDFVFLLVDDMRSSIIGVEYIIACADSASVSFYEKNDFVKLSEHYEVPREGWNRNCIPMVLRLPEINVQTYTE
jgi:ribosomal protein S18 acetylase RimI-like enzyme